MEEAWHKARIIESKFKKSVHTNFKKYDSKKKLLQSAYTGNPRYTAPQLREVTNPSLEAQRIKEGKCKLCGDKWDPKNICLQNKLYSYEAEEVEFEVEEPIENVVNSQQYYQTEIEDDTPKISLVIIIRMSQLQTLKIKGHKK